MTIALWCVLIAGLLPYLAATIAKAGAERFDNRNPRAWLARQQGFRARANAAQLNSFEAFPFFAVAVIVAYLAHAPADRIDVLAAIFIAVRLGYLGCYLADLHWARSTLWLVGWVTTITIFVSGVTAK
ncbi:MAG: MAPEG family protein [Gemmatimonadota bacterium]